jgi:hypothetical protein
LLLCHFVNNPTDTENANPQEAFSLQKYKKWKNIFGSIVIFI